MTTKTLLRKVPRRWLTRLTVALALLAGAGLTQGVRAQLFGHGPPSPVIFPDQTITIHFSHRKHLAKGVKCQTCHEKIAKSMFGKDRNLPNGGVCDTCHGTDHDEYKPGKMPTAEKLVKKCRMCHPTYKGDGRDVVRPIDLPAPNLKFNHRIHVQRNIDCKECHGDLTKVDLATREKQFPKMNDCLRCHDGRKAPQACGTCHLTDRDDRLVQQFPQGRLLPTQQLRGAAHDIEWQQKHRQVVANDRKLCQSCHSEDYCLNCHNNVLKPQSIHPNDWISIHPVAARKNEPNCQSCHRLQSFCLGCHERALVGIRARTRGMMPGAFRPGGIPGTGGGGRFHPPNWIAVGGRSLHPVEAQRNMRACVSCHRESFCMSCHATAARLVPNRDNPGVGIGAGSFAGQNPHPRDWVSGGRCRRIAQKNYRVCLKCHVPEDQLLGQCR